MGRNGANTEGYITEIAKDMEDCQMLDFKWTDMQVLMIINALNSSDKDEAQLAERLTETYNSSILNKKVLEISHICKIIADFWSEIRERRQIMFTPEKGKDTEKKDGIKEGDKENKKRKM